MEEDSIKVWTLPYLKTRYFIRNNNHAENTFIKLTDRRLAGGSKLEINLFEPIGHKLLFSSKGYDDIVVCLFQ